jgi:hypothetical protein
MKWWWGPLCTRPTLSWILIVLAHWNNSLRIDMSLHSDTLSWFRANQSLLFLLNAAYLVEKQQNTNFIVLFSPDRGLNPWSIALEASRLTIRPLEASRLTITALMRLPTYMDVFTVNRTLGVKMLMRSFRFLFCFVHCLL